MPPESTGVAASSSKFSNASLPAHWRRPVHAAIDFSRVARIV
jgi:hypothetical protein